MKKIQGQMSETFLLGTFLTLVGGFLDAYTYLSRGHVFANAQTGNMVLLGLNLAQGRWGEVLHYAVPILSFALGIIVAELVRRQFRTHPAIHWRQIIVGAEILILAVVAFLPQGNWDATVNIAISFLCALQVESFRKINGNACATTMCTGNLRSGTELLFHAFSAHDPAALRRALQYYAIILIFIAGAVLGILTTGPLGERSVLLCCALLAVVFAVMFIKEDAKDP